MPENTPATTPIPETPAVVPAPEPAPTSFLPAAVQAIRRIEQKNSPGLTKPTVPSGTVPPDKTGKGKMLFNFIPWTGRVGLVFKVLFAGLAAVLAFFLVVILLMVTSIDTSIFKLSLYGNVIDNANQPVDGATITIDGQQGTTANGGQFNIGGLSIGTYTVDIKANGYEELTQQVALARGFLSYGNYRQFTLKKSGIATLSGKLIPPTAGYQFTNDRILINDKEFRVNADGTFKALELTTGKTTFTFQSINFKDETREFQLAAGDQSLPDIPLTAAGDIVASVKSWIREDLVLNLKVTVEGVDDQFIAIDQTGNLRVRDLDIGKEYKLRTEYPGYETRDYTITIAQGENQLFNFKVVEKGFLPFQRKVNNVLELFVANFDGVNEKQLTTGDIQAYGEYIDNSNLYFMSTRDNLHSDIGVTSMLAYVVPVAGGNPQRVTTSTDNLGRIIPNLKAGKLADVTFGTTDKSRKLEVMDLQGNNRNTIETIPDGSFDHVEISDDGTTIWYSMQNVDKTVNGLYRSSTDSKAGHGSLILSKPDMIVYSVSNSGDRVLYSTTNTSTNLQDLHMYTFSTKQDSLVKASITGSQFQFVKGSETEVIFIDIRDGNTNLFMTNLSTNTDTKLSGFSNNTEGAEAIFQQAGYVLYRSNKGLYVIDPSQPHPGKLVTTNVARYTGYDF